jgi:hypothetical protein
MLSMLGHIREQSFSMWPYNIQFFYVRSYMRSLWENSLHHPVNIVGNIPWPPWQWVYHGIVQFAFFILSKEKVSGKIENNYKFIEEHLHIYSEAGPLG